jgi:SAM-dependent methyltransferase
VGKIISRLYRKAGPITREGLIFLSCLRRNRIRQARHYLVWFFERLKLCVINRKKVICECCGWQGNNFFPYLNVESGNYRAAYELCPQCYSKSRFRLLVKYIKSHSEFLPKKNIRLLEIGPVKSFQDWLLTLRNIEYFSADLENRAGVKTVMDIRQLGFLDKSFDIVICSHVLEHIKEDNIALRELGRILRDDGIIFILVSIDIRREETAEYNEPNSKEFGHVRLYGRDFLIRLRKCGFTTNTNAINFASALSMNELAMYGLKKEEKLFLAAKA